MLKSVAAHELYALSAFMHILVQDRPFDLYSWDTAGEKGSLDLSISSSGDVQTEAHSLEDVSFNLSFDAGVNVGQLPAGSLDAEVAKTTLSLDFFTQTVEQLWCQAINYYKKSNQPLEDALIKNLASYKTELCPQDVYFSLVIPVLTRQQTVH